MINVLTHDVIMEESVSERLITGDVNNSEMPSSVHSGDELEC